MKEYSAGIVEKKTGFFDRKGRKIEISFVPIDPFQRSMKYSINEILWDDEEACTTKVLLMNEEPGDSVAYAWAFGSFYRDVRGSLRLEFSPWWSDTQFDEEIVSDDVIEGKKHIFELLVYGDEEDYTPHYGVIHPDYFEGTFLGKDGPSKRVLWTSAHTEGCQDCSKILSLDGFPVEMIFEIDDGSSDVEKNAARMMAETALSEDDWLIIDRPEICADEITGEQIVKAVVQSATTRLVLEIMTNEEMALFDRWKVCGFTMI